MTTSKQVRRPKWKPVSNQQFQEALANSDISNLLASESRKYRQQLDPDIIESLRLYSLWKTLACHDDQHVSRQKFTTSLYRIIHWEFRRALRDFGRQSRKELFSWEGDLEDLVYQEEELSELGECDLRDLRLIEDQARFLPTVVWNIVRGHYLEGKSIRELSLSFNLDPHSIHKRLRWGIRRLQELCDEGYCSLEDAA